MGFKPVVGENCFAARELPDDRFAYVELALMRQAQICIGDENTCEHRYTYPDLLSALQAFLIWTEEDTEEPEGWHRHQPSNRRRPNGDPNHEYIRP